jgi:hypothetical protein|tara:strand:+ start:692 stop:1123 length:432 start_codon:yes stop_codon:yes gene_type:complete
MIQTIYAEVPREKIIYLERAEFMNGQEQSFRDTLTASMSKHGFKDPVYCWYRSKNWGDKIKIIVGNNRMVVAKELDIKIIPAIITNFKADESPLEGRVLKTDDEIRALFHLPNHDKLHIRRNENGDIDQVTPPHFPTVKQHYV